MRYIGRLFEIVVRLTCMAILLLSALVLAVSLATTVVFRQYEENDLFDFVGENVPLLLLSMAAVLAVMILITNCKRHPGQDGTGAAASGEPAVTVCHSLRRPPFPWVLVLTAGALSLFLVLVVRGLPTADASELDAIINQFMAGDYSALSQGGYLYNYPYQMPYIYFGEILAHLFGQSNYIAWQLLNVVCIMLNMYFLYQITWELFESRRICRVMQVLGCGAFCFYVFSTFIYNDVWSFAAQTAAVYLQILYLKRRRIRYEFGAAVCIVFACQLKMNSVIAMIAMILVLLVDAVWRQTEQKRAQQGRPAQAEQSRTQQSRTEQNQTEQNRTGRGSGPSGTPAAALAVLFSLLMIGLWAGSSAAVDAYTVQRTGIEKMPEGVPNIAFIAMSMQEAEGKCGWYNGFTKGTYTDTGYDAEETKARSIAAIQNSLAEFDNSGRYFVNFYYQKFISQWGDPTCVSMRELENTSRHTDNSALADSLIYGTGGQVLQWVMNVFHSLVYLGMIIYTAAAVTGKRRREGTGPGGDGSASSCAEKSRRLSSEEVLLVVFIFGGMLFHELWEASGRYTMRYYLTMLPLAAWGLERMTAAAAVGTGKFMQRMGDK